MYCRECMEKNGRVVKVNKAKVTYKDGTNEEVFCCPHHGTRSTRQYNFGLVTYNDVLMYICDLQKKAEKLASMMRELIMEEMELK